MGPTQLTAAAASAAPAVDKHEEYAQHRRRYWDDFARSLSERWSGIRRYYLDRLARIYGFLVPRGVRVLELGCGQGDLLAALDPSCGVGVDFSGEMVARGRQRYPHLRLIEADVHNFDLGETFDYIIVSDLLNDVWDVQQVLAAIHGHCHPQTRVVINTYSRVWELPRRVAQALHVARPQMPQNWLTGADIENLLYLASFDVIRCFAEILCPVYLPLLSTLANRYLVKLWPFRLFALTYFAVARPRPQPGLGAEPVVSVVVAARNEEGNISAIFDRIPQMGGGTELIFVEGGSRDDTWGAIEREMRRHPNVNAALYKQPGKGKGDAVRTGFDRASGEILMILDADLTVPPEDLPRFYDAVRSGAAEFANGVRLVYPMEDHAMRFFNHIGNRFFSFAFSWLLGQRIKDTLCGTKVLGRIHYRQIADNRNYFGDFDPFGDFDLIFGAAKLNLKLVDIPIRYRERTYGETNIQRWRSGVVLLRMVGVAMHRLKFIS
jgi:ubiquinone/menaquinone biosynthesis C-methylase UbiE